jgi:hypothetical protein
MISAVIEGSAPVATRNHFGHEFQRESETDALPCDVVARLIR